MVGGSAGSVGFCACSSRWGSGTTRGTWVGDLLRSSGATWRGLRWAGGWFVFWWRDNKLRSLHTKGCRNFLRSLYKKGCWHVRHSRFGCNLKELFSAHEYCARCFWQPEGPLRVKPYIFFIHGSFSPWAVLNADMRLKHRRRAEVVWDDDLITGFRFYSFVPFMFLGFRVACSELFFIIRAQFRTRLRRLQHRSQDWKPLDYSIKVVSFTLRKL